MNWKQLATVVTVGLSAAWQAQAMIRFGCSQLVTQRFDPLVTPGQVSPHLHQIIGGNAFNLTMDTSLDLPELSTCTTCRFKEDFSNYWTAVMYFKHPNGSYFRVPQSANHYTGEPDGGMTIYYIQPPTNEKVTAFPKGFRMIVGDPMLRSSRKSLDPTSAEAWALSFRCWETEGFFDPSNSYPPGAGKYDAVHLPNKFCAGGIRANIFFPSCWNGKDIDTPDHHSHVAFHEGTVNPNIGIILMNGKCPASHPVRLPLLFYETFWDTRGFKDMWPTDGSQPLVLSQGDPTGYGQHGDYVFGWEGDSLQRAMDNCYDGFGWPEACPDLTIQTDEEINACRQPPQVDETVEGEFIDALPGCNPVQDGPGYATMVPTCTAVSTTGIAAATPAAKIPPSRIRRASVTPAA